MFKKTYTEPTICIEDVVVENGIATSPSSIVFGDYGEAGMGGEGYVDDYGNF